MSNQLKKLKKNLAPALEEIKTPVQINLFSYVADNQGCGHIRVMFPYLLLNHYKEVDKVKIMTNWGHKFIPDPGFYKELVFCQFQRAVTKPQLDMIKYLKQRICAQTKTPLIYEIDDLLINIPEWNFSNTWYEQQQEYIPEILSQFDGIITSTERLKKIYSKYNSNIKVIPNHLPKFLWGEPLPFKQEITNKKPRIFWGGSSNHFAIKKDQVGGDFGKDLIEYIKGTTDKYQWVIMGGCPQELTEYKDKIEYHPWKNIFTYPSYVKNLNIDLCIAPLEDNLFNASKSNLKSLEFSMLGAPAVYSDVEPYADKTIACKTDGDIIANIEKLLINPELRKEVYEKDFELIRKQLFWEEYDNLTSYLNTYLSVFGKKLVANK